jgi:adenosylcobinamide-GDP ribazoletransferase
LSFRRALQLLTRLPVPVSGEPEFDWLARSAKWFPLVGIGIGVVAGGVFFGARFIWPSGAIPALLAIAVAALLTGCLHEDGLADVADGLGAGRDVESRLRIMKDSHIGTYGVLVLILAIAAKAAALGGLTGWEGLEVLIAAHGLARAGCSVAMAALAYVRPAETSKFGPISKPSWPETAFAIASGLFALIFMPWDAILASLAAGLIAGAAIGWIARAKLGGYTGDVLGAIEQTIEVAVMLAASATVGGLATVATAGHVL